MMVALRSSETSVLTRATWHNIPEDGILDSIKSIEISIGNMLQKSVKNILLNNKFVWKRRVHLCCATILNLRGYTIWYYYLQEISEGPDDELHAGKKKKKPVTENIF
jgi:hypothetical protein